MKSPRYLPLFICLLSVNHLSGQFVNLPAGPDWKATDLNGQSHQLYDYLNQGKIVFMDVFATWCSPCLSYQQSGKFKDIYNIYGPNGTDEARVFAIETDPKTGIPQLFGVQPLTVGDYVTGTPYPIIDKPRLEEAFDARGYPSLYCVCPDRKTFELGHGASATALWGMALDSCTNFNFIKTRMDTVMPVRCKNDMNGEVRMSVLNGIPPYSFQWSNGATTKNISGLSGGRYVCTITDALGKTGRASAFVPKPPDSMYLSLAKIQQRCDFPGDPNGILSATGANGISPYSVIWNTGATTYTIENLSAGTYSVTVSDTYGCVRKMENIEIFPKYQPVAAIAPAKAISCAQPISLLNATGSSTFPFDTLYWYRPDGTWVTGDPSMTFAATVPGLYRLSIFNWSSHCDSWASVFVAMDTIRPMAEAGPAKQQNCSGIPVTLQGSGSGSGSLSYAWSTSGGNILSGANTLTPSVSGAGTYSLTVTRTLSGCSRSDATTVTVLNQTPITQAAATVLNCSNPIGSITGTSSIQGSTFKWTGPGNFSSTQNPATVTQPGIYTLTTTAPGGCSTTTTVTVVADNAQPQVIVETQGLITCDQLTTLLSASATPANALFNWSGPNGFNATSPQTLVSQPGVYTIEVTAPNGCASTNSVTVMADQTPPQLTVEVPGMLTCDQQTILLKASASPANAAFYWSGPNGFTATSPQTLVSQPGIYTIVVTAPNGCASTNAVAVMAEQSLPVITIVPPENLTCAQTSLELNASSPGAAPLLWQWSTSTGHIVSGSNTANPVINAAGIYLVSVTNTLTGCSSQASVVVLSNTPLSESIPIVQPASCPDASDGMAEVVVGLGTPPFTFQWSDGQTTQQASGLPVGMVSVMISDAAGCSQMLQMQMDWADHVPPMLLCPADKTVSFCQSIVFYDLPVATDNCAIEAAPVLLEGPAPGFEFPTGLTQVQYEISDVGNNKATCSFTVTVAAPLDLSGIVQADTSGASVGAIDLSTSGGLSPYTFAWTKDNLPFSNSEDILLASAGQYSLMVTDAGGCTAESTFVIPLITSTSDLQHVFGLQLFPNPATDRVILSTSEPQVSRLWLALYDVRGVLQQEWQQIPEFIDVSLCPAGVYYLQIKSQEQSLLGWAKVLIKR